MFRDVISFRTNGKTHLPAVLAIVNHAPAKDLLLPNMARPSGPVPVRRVVLEDTTAADFADCAAWLRLFEAGELQVSAPTARVLGSMLYLPGIYPFDRNADPRDHIGFLSETQIWGSLGLMSVRVLPTNEQLSKIRHKVITDALRILPTLLFRYLADYTWGIYHTMIEYMSDGRVKVTRPILPSTSRGC